MVPLLALDAAATDFDLTGQVVWPAAMLLSWAVLRRAEAGLLPTRCRVLELGAGMGLTGLLSAQLPAVAEVVLTDGNEVVCETLRENVALQKQSASAVSCEQLQWGAGPRLEAFASQHGRFELIVGADCVYWQSGIAPLLQTCDRLLAADGCVLLAHQSRATRTDRDLLYAEIAKAGFAFEETRGDSLRALLPADGGGVPTAGLADSVLVTITRSLPHSHQQQQ